MQAFAEEFDVRQLLVYDRVLGLLGPLYLAAAAALGAWFLWSGVRLGRERSDDAARAVFRTSLVYLALLYAAMLADLLI